MQHSMINNGYIAYYIRETTITA